MFLIFYFILFLHILLIDYCRYQTIMLVYLIITFVDDQSMYCPKTCVYIYNFKLEFRLALTPGLIKSQVLILSSRIFSIP